MFDAAKRLGDLLAKKQKEGAINQIIDVIYDEDWDDILERRKEQKKNKVSDYNTHTL